MTNIIVYDVTDPSSCGESAVPSGNIMKYCWTSWHKQQNMYFLVKRFYHTGSVTQVKCEVRVKSPGKLQAGLQKTD